MKHIENISSSVDGHTEISKYTRFVPRETEFSEKMDEKQFNEQFKGMYQFYFKGSCEADILDPISVQASLERMLILIEKEREKDLERAVLKFILEYISPHDAVIEAMKNKLSPKDED
jgi:hypothetical protein